MPYKLIGHIPCGTEACTTATHSSSECNSVNGNINVDLTPVAKESTLLTESEAIKKAIENLDLSSVESKVEEESQAIQGKIDNIDLTPIENKVDEGVSALSTKIDNIKLPEIDTTELAKESTLLAESAAIKKAIADKPDVDLSEVAKEVTLQEVSAKVTSLEALITNSVLKEVVTIILNCQDSVEWSEYAVEVTMANGSVQYVPITENGTCSFSIRLGQEYSVQLPIFGTYIVPHSQTYTAMTTAREIYWSYVVAGVFGLDELGRRYSIEQIESLENKSIIKYGGYTDDYLENSSRDDGGIGNGFMWEIGNEKTSNIKWSSSYILFDVNLLPKLGTEKIALTYCNGKSYTEYMIAESIRTNVGVPAASWCIEREITIKHKSYKGFLPAYGQLRRLAGNSATINLMYNILGIDSIGIESDRWWASNQTETDNHALGIVDGKYPQVFAAPGLPKIFTYKALRIFDLPR